MSWVAFGKTTTADLRIVQQVNVLVRGCLLQLAAGSHY